MWHCDIFLSVPSGGALENNCPPATVQLYSVQNISLLTCFVLVLCSLKQHWGPRSLASQHLIDSGPHVSHLSPYRTEIWESTHITNIQLWIISTSTFFEYFPKILVIIFLSRNFHLIQNISWNNWDYRTQKHYWRKLNWLLMKLLSRYLFQHLTHNKVWFGECLQFRSHFVCWGTRKQRQEVTWEIE